MINSDWLHPIKNLDEFNPIKNLDEFKVALPDYRPKSFYKNINFNKSCPKLHIRVGF